MPIERELRFRLESVSDADAMWRRLGLAPKSEKIVSVYYDTPRRHLQRHGVALRLRRYGGRWLQTLKGAARDGLSIIDRTEWEVPARSGRLETQRFPLEEIRNAIGLDVRVLQSPLSPVFETRFVRQCAINTTVEGAQIEIAVDIGTIVAGRQSCPLGEIELELKRGDAAALISLSMELAKALRVKIEPRSKAERGYALADDMESRPQKALHPEIRKTDALTDALQVVVGACVVQISGNAEGVLRSRDPEYLHQLRVGIRRLRSALRAFRGIPSSVPLAPLVEQLRHAQPILGSARDWDVVVGLLTDDAHDVARADRRRLALLGRIRDRRRRARRAARAYVDESGFQQLMLGVLEWMAGSTAAASGGVLATSRRPSAGAFARRTVRRLARKVHRLGARMQWSDAGDRHELRIRLKRLRYVSDFFAHCFPASDIRRYLRRLGRLQDILGDLNDIETTRRLLGECAPQHPGRPAAAVLQRLAKRERRLVARLRPAWREFARLGDPH